MSTSRFSMNQGLRIIQIFENRINALMDRYDRQKPAEELTDTERFSLELKRFERENERLRMENDFLKKLEEIARMSRT